MWRWPVPCVGGSTSCRSMSPPVPRVTSGTAGCAAEGAICCCCFNSWRGPIRAVWRAGIEEVLCGIETPNPFQKDLAKALTKLLRRRAAACPSEQRLVLAQVVVLHGDEFI